MSQYKEDLLQELELEQYTIHEDRCGNKYLVLYSWAPLMANIVDESNARALDKLFEGVEEYAHLGDRRLNGIIGVSLGAPYATLQKAKEVIDGLTDYPLICDSVFSEVEAEHIESLWGDMSEEERKELQYKAGNDENILWSFMRDMLY